MAGGSLYSSGSRVQDLNAVTCVRDRGREPQRVWRARAGEPGDEGVARAGQRESRERAGGPQGGVVRVMGETHACGVHQRKVPSGNKIDDALIGIVGGGQAPI
eukprot:377823-Prymnesium_polylepis.1